LVRVGGGCIGTLVGEIQGHRHWGWMGKEICQPGEGYGSGPAATGTVPIRGLKTAIVKEQTKISPSVSQTGNRALATGYAGGLESGSRLILGCSKVGCASSVLSSTSLVWGCAVQSSRRSGGFAVCTAVALCPLLSPHNATHPYTPQASAHVAARDPLADLGKTADGARASAGGPGAAAGFPPQRPDSAGRLAVAKGGAVGSGSEST
jgi:hypothetical protein